ncbi:hypothetical protein AtNW77_Chr2g0227661 [Arabidopsis thaliana]
MNQTHGGNLVLVRSRIVDNSSTNKAAGEKVVTVTRRSNVNKGAKDKSLVGTRSTSLSRALAKKSIAAKEIKEFHTKLVVGKLDPNSGRKDGWDVLEEHSNEGDSPFKWCPWPLKTEKRRLHWDRLCKLQKETNLGLIGKGLGSQNMGLGRRGNGPTMVIGPIKENPRNQIAGQEALEARRLRWRGTDRVVGADIFDKARVRGRYGDGDKSQNRKVERKWSRKIQSLLSLIRKVWAESVDGSEATV